MSHFETSKGYQDIILTAATRKLLIAEFNADLAYRQNLKVHEHGVVHRVGDCEVTLLPSDHMLGSVQVAVSLPDGMRVGYSGDFHWPLDEAIKVDALVLDSTYGSPEKKRQYSQGDAEAALMALVHSKLATGPIQIKAFRGTLQRALQVLTGLVDCPLIGSPHLCAEVDVYRQFGYGIAPLIPADSPDSRRAIKEGRFIQFYGKGDRLPVQPKGITVTLSAYMSRPDDPLMTFSERAYAIAMSNHADFDGTLAYVDATGAEFVLTDSTRGASALQLAVEIRNRLGKKALPSSQAASHEWGV